MRGGYKLINFGGADLSNATSSATAVTIAGIYDAIESNYPTKFYVFAGVNTTGSNDLTFVPVVGLNSTDFVASLGTTFTVSSGTVTLTETQIVITDEDNVYLKTVTVDVDEAQ